MFTTAASRVTNFLGSWNNILALGTLPILGAWIYTRVWMVNPAILGDEYLYSLNARKGSPWGPVVAGDYSNYLFNFVYQSTNLCGPDFYQCTKILNIGFFLGFVFLLFLVALRFVNFWIAYIFMIAAALSPLSVYTSMFLPESLYFFLMGLLVIRTLGAMQNFSWSNWTIVGFLLGVASLIKPHAWLTALAIGITLLVVGLGDKRISLPLVITSVAGILAGALGGRIIVGLLVAGPKSLNFFGSYVSEGTVNQILDGGSDQPVEGSLAGSTPVDGAIGLFWPQIASHSISVVGLMAISIAIVILAVLGIFRTREMSPASALSLLSLIWLLTLMVEISLFTGWITGLGDDHTNRILIRYYDFLLLIVPLAALVAASDTSLRENKSILRWGLVLLMSIPLTAAFTSHFATLEIQIADAPNLAGLVVNQTVFSSVATVSLIGLVALAAFPKSAKALLTATFPLMMIATGWQIQDQYQIFRGEKSAADMAGQYVHENFSLEEMSEITILANSRFDATNAGFWMDVPDIQYEVPAPGTLIPVELFPEERRIILIIGDYEVQGDYAELLSNENFRILDARPRK